MTAEPEDVIDLEHEEYDLGSDFFYGFEFFPGFPGSNSAAAAEYFRRFWDDLRTYSDDEFERTYHDFTHRTDRGGREGHGGRKGKKYPKKAGPADRGRRAANAETRDAEKTRERPRATDDGSASARLARKWILEHVPPRPAMVRRETREVTLRLTKNDAFPSFPIVGQPPIGFVRKFAVEVKKERDGPFPRTTAEKDANVDAKKNAASRSRASESSRREVFDASTGRASATVTVGGLEPGVRYRFRTRLGCGSEDDVTWGEPGVESAYATKSAPEKSDAEKNAANNAAPGRARSSEQPSEKGVASPHASPSSASECAFAKKKSAAPVSSRETALAAVAAAEEAERAAEAAKAEKKRAGQLAAMTPGERSAEAAREEAEAAAAHAKAAKQRARADVRKEKKRLAAARAAEREREERARAAEREREFAEIYRAQFAADTAELSAPFRSSATPDDDEGAGKDLAFRTKPCRFFLSGKGCKLGDACRFAHDAAAASERAQRLVSVPAADHSAPALRAGASEAGSSLSSAQRRARAYKTKPCRYWTLKGTCTRGDACGFIHEPTPSRTKAYKTKLCRYWTQKGTCARGDACGFIHGDAPEYAGGVEPATQTAHFASHSATYCGVCRLPFGTEDELVEHLWSDAHRDRINVASEWHDDA